MRGLALAAVAATLVAAGGAAWRIAARERAAPEPRGDAAIADPLEDPAAPLLLEAAKLLVDSDPPPVPVKIEQAIEILKRAGDRSPGSPDVELWKGIAAYMAGDEAGATAAAARLKAKSPNGERDPRLHYLNAITILRFKKKPGEALKEARLAKSIGPQWKPEWVNLATYRALKQFAAEALNTGRADAAVQALQEALKLIRQNREEAIDARRWLVRALGRAFRFVEAEEEARLLVSEGKDIAEFHFLLAHVVLEQKKWEEAASEFGQVLRLIEEKRVPISDVPKFEISRLRLGDCLRLLGRVEEGRKEIEGYVTEHPDDARGHYVLGNFYLDTLDQPDEAVAEWERCRVLAPWCEETLHALLRVYEVAKPDPLRAKALHDEIDQGKARRDEERARQAKIHPDGLEICQ